MGPIGMPGPVSRPRLCPWPNPRYAYGLGKLRPYFPPTLVFRRPPNSGPSLNPGSGPVLVPLFVPVPIQFSLRPGPGPGLSPAGGRRRLSPGERRHSDQADRPDIISRDVVYFRATLIPPRPGQDARTRGEAPGRHLSHGTRRGRRGMRTEGRDV